MDKKEKIIILSIILLALVLRVIPNFIEFPNQLFEPDNYIYLVSAQYAITHNFNISDPYSSFPKHLPFPEHPGMVLLLTIPSYITGINIFTIEVYLPIICGILAVIFIGILGYLITKDKRIGLLASLIMAILPTAIYKSITWRGEVVILPISLLILILLLKGRDYQERKCYILYAFVIFLTLLAYWTWSGSTYILGLLGMCLLVWIVNKVMHRRWLTIIVTTLAVIFIIIATLPQSIIFLSLYSANLTINETAPPTLLTTFGDFGIIPLFTVIGFFLTFKDPLLENSRLDYLYGMLIAGIFVGLNVVRFEIFLAPSIAILASYGFIRLYDRLKDTPLYKNYLLAFAVVTILATLAISLKGDLTINQARVITPSYIQALNWISNNTSPSSTFLTDWASGSGLEAISHRQSWSDSVISIGAGFSLGKFLYAKAGNSSYLYSINKPNYLLVERNWYNKSGTCLCYSIAIEANVPMVFNGSNLLAFENSATSRLNSSNTSFTKVFDNNYSIIYKIYYRTS